MAKLSELIKCLEDGGQIMYRSTGGFDYAWHDISMMDLDHMVKYLNQYSMREAPPKPKEVTFRAWMYPHNICKDTIESNEEIDFYCRYVNERITQVEITIKEVVE